MSMVKFIDITRTKFNSLTPKDDASVYFVKETNNTYSLYKGSTLVSSNIAPPVHDHNSLYNTKTEITSLLAGKQSTVTGAATTITSSDLTKNRALISNGSGKVAVSAVTSTELGYLSGVTSNIQTQLNSKLNLAGGTMTGSITMGSNNITGNNSSIFQAGRIIATNSNTNAHGITSKGTRANMLYLMDGVTGGLAASLLDVDVKNTTTPQKRIAKIGVFGGAVSSTDGTPYANYLWLSAVDGNTYNKDATLKVDARNRVGVAIAGSGRPTQALDVDGKIRMRTTTVDSDSSDIVVTKGYMLSKIASSDTNNYLTNVSGSANGVVTLTRQGLVPLTWDATHDHNSLYNTKTEITSLLVGKANNNEVVKLSGAQNIPGIKTFTNKIKTDLIQGISEKVSIDLEDYQGYPNLEISSTGTGQIEITGFNNLQVKTTLNMNNNKIAGVADPTQPYDAINKSYVDTELATKVDKDGVKGLSTNDYTTAEKNKLAGIASGAEVNVQADWNETNSSSDAFIKNKPLQLIRSRGATSNLTNTGAGVYGIATSIALNREKTIMVEVNFNSGSYASTSKIVTISLGYATSTPNATTNDNIVSVPIWNNNLSELYIYSFSVSYSGSTLYFGNKTYTLIGYNTSAGIVEFTNTSNTYSLYVGKIWAV